MRRFSVEVDARLRDLARPGGVLTTRLLTAARIHRACVAARLRSGWLLRPAQGLFVIADLRSDLTETSLVQARYPDTVAIGLSGALLHGLDGLDRPHLLPPEVVAHPTHARARRTAMSGIVTRTVDEADVVVVQGLRTLAPVPLLVSLAPLVSIDLLEAAVETFLRRREVTEAQLWDQPLHEVLELRGRGTPPAESYLELLTVQRVFRPAGLAHRRQVPVHVNGSFLGRFDFELESGLLVEVDGARTHRTVTGVQRDNWHATSVRLGGRDVEHVTWEDVTRRPRATARRLAQRSAQVAARADAP